MVEKQQRPPLFEFAYCHNFNKLLSELADLAMKEEWSFRNSAPYSILKNYIHHTFARLLEEVNEGKEHKICYSSDESYACFNTGLYTEKYEQIYGLFSKNRNPGRQKWFLKGFHKESDRVLERFSSLPARAEYFKDISDLIYDYRLDIRINVDHILDDPANLARLPSNLQKDKQRALLIIRGAVDIAKKRVAANYKLAVPQYYQRQIQLLIPLCFDNDSKADVALPIYRQGNFYVGRTLLTLEMAYNNARLIARPDSDWLRP